MKSLVVLAFVLVASGAGCPAYADRGHVDAGDDDFNAVIRHVEPGAVQIHAASDSGEPAPAGAVAPPCAEHQPCGENLVCQPDQTSPWGGVLLFDDGGPPMNLGWCSPSAGASAQPQITNALVLRALRRVDLPASELGVQPPGGETLVNFETNFFTDSGAFTRSVRLLGRRVDLRVWPSRFHWVFGDGADLASSGAGARYPDLEITHAYETKGPVRPSVDTTYAARYRVDGGPWRDVVGTVTIPGSAVRLVVRTARPVLVSYR